VRSPSHVWSAFGIALACFGACSENGSAPDDEGSGAGTANAGSPAAGHGTGGRGGAGGSAGASQGDGGALGGIGGDGGAPDTGGAGPSTGGNGGAGGAGASGGVGGATGGAGGSGGGSGAGATGGSSGGLAGESTGGAGTGGASGSAGSAGAAGGGGDPSCREVAFDSKTYEFCPLFGFDWYAARAYCNSRGADLISINTEAENAFAYTEHVEGGSIWTSGNDLASEGVWLWGDGTYLNAGYLNWAATQPNNAEAGENCAVLHSGAGDWNDVACTEVEFATVPISFICEGV